MRRRLPQPPPEMPARLRCFEPAEWADPSDPPGWAGERAAQDRWHDAVREWGRENNVTPVDIVRQLYHDRRAARGWVDPPDGSARR